MLQVKRTGHVPGFPGGKWLQQHVVDPLMYAGKPVEWRNYEASYDILELESRSREASTYVLQEYFVPVTEYALFYPKLTGILKKHKVNVVNISIRHAKQDLGCMLAWAKDEVFAFVIYYRQGTSAESREEVKHWTQELIDASLNARARITCHTRSMHHLRSSAGHIQAVLVSLS